MRRSFFKVILLLVLVVMAAVGGRISEAAAGGTLKLRLDNEVATIHPHRATDTIALTVIRAISSGLYERRDGSVPQLAAAESVDKSADGLTYVFKLKDGKWSNGTPVTAHDFVFGWRNLADPANGFQYATLFKSASILNADAVAKGEKPVTELGVRAIDDKTLEVKLERPLAYFETVILFPSLAPVNEEFFKSQGDLYGTSAETIISNGPFKIASYQPSATTITLEKNPGYPESDKIKLDGIKFQVIKDNQQSLLVYENDDLDVFTLAGEQAELYIGDPEYKPVVTGGLWYVTPNISKVKGLDNLNVRLALAHSFDKETLVNTVLKDGSIPADFVITRKTHTRPDGTDIREYIGDFLKTDKEAAKKYWEKAKAELGVDKFTFSILVEDTEETINAVQFLQAQIQETLPGITIKVEQMPKKNRMDRQNAGDYELGLTRWGPDYQDATTYLDLFLTVSPWNFGGWSNAEYDRLVKAISEELSNDEEARSKAIKDAELLLAGNAVVFPVYQKGMAYLIKSNVHGIEFSPTGVLIFNFASID